MTDAERIAILYDQKLVTHMSGKIHIYNRLRWMLNQYNKLQELLCNGRGKWGVYDVETYNDEDPKNPLLVKETKLLEQIRKTAKLINPRWRIVQEDLFLAVYMKQRIPGYRDWHDRSITCLVYKD